MSTAGHVEVAPIPASIDNVEQWGEIAQQIASETGIPTEITPEIIAAMLGSAVPMLFAADAAKDTNVMRGTFTDAVIAQCERNAGGLEGQQPTAATISLVGAHMQKGQAVVRARVAIHVRDAAGTESMTNQFWDLQIGAQLTVGQPTCPNCGAPITKGALACEHCGADVRGTVHVPLAVSKLELY
jgi:hypothetical protein